MPAVLFVCTRNLYRSPVAASLFQRLLEPKIAQGEAWTVASAGTWARSGEKLPDEAVLMVRGLGLDLSQHSASLVSDLPLQEYDLILTMEAGHKEALRYEFPAIKDRVYQLTELADFPFDVADPQVAEPGKLGVVFEEIRNLINDNFQLICDLVTKNRDE